MKTDLLLIPMGARWADVRAAAIAAEEAGFDGLWTWDHLRDPDGDPALEIKPQSKVAGDLMLVITVDSSVTTAEKAALVCGGKRITYGHSLIADPWGHIVAKASDGTGWATARIDPALTARVRRDMPVLDHRKLA